MQFIQRNYERTEHDDYVLNIQSRCDKHQEAMPFYDEKGNLIGWKIQGKYE